MSQLLVRRLETSVVRKLRRRATADGVSLEEAHRRVLRAALLGPHPDAQGNLLEYLQSIPRGGGVKFLRATDKPRRVEF